MNKILGIVLGLSSMGSLAFSQTTATTAEAPVADALTVDASFGYESQFFFRGWTIAKDSLQTDLSLSYQNYSLGVWNHAPLRSSQSSTSEFDFYGSAETSLTDSITGALGFTLYYYPSVSGQGVDTVTFEPNVTFTFDLSDKIYISPSVMIAYDTELQNWTFEASTDYSFGLCDALDLELGAGVGLVTVHHGKNYAYGQLSANVVYSVKEPVQVYVGARGGFNSLGKADRGSQKSTEFWFGAGVRASF
jgi:uncharacterized protein (TIGR02001 family)